MYAEKWNEAPAALNVHELTSTSLGYGTTVMFGFSAGEHERIAAAARAESSSVLVVIMVGFTICAKIGFLFYISSIIICAEITLRNMLAGYTVAYATAGSSPSPEGLAKSSANGLAMLPQSIPTLSA